MIQAALAAVGVGMAVAGLFKGNKSSKDAQNAQNAITQASIRAESLRAEAMKQESFRNRREIMRQAMIARSSALSSAANTGAVTTSGFEGGQAQITSMEGQKLTAANENLEIGQSLFSANRDRMNAEMSLARARTSQQTSSALFSTGVSLMNNARPLADNFYSLTETKRY